MMFRRLNRLPPTRHLDAGQDGSMTRPRRREPDQRTQSCRLKSPCRCPAIGERLYYRDQACSFKRPVTCSSLIRLRLISVLSKSATALHQTAGVCGDQVNVMARIASRCRRLACACFVINGCFWSWSGRNAWIYLFFADDTISYRWRH